jgi:hypothetical protein
MLDKQYLLDGTIVPVAPHRDDVVECSDGTVCARRDVCFDCKGGAHSNDDDRKESDVEIVRDILNGVVEWSENYHTDGGDYADGVAYIVHECSHDWPARVEEWIRDNHGDYYGRTKHDDRMEELVEYICNEIAAYDDYEPEYDRSNYSCYSGPDCCLYSLEIGECEEQVDVDAFDELKALHESGDLDDVLDELDRDFCIMRSRRRVKNEETGRYEEVGRETYMPYEHHAEHPTFCIYTLPSGQWHYVVEAERMEQIISEFYDDIDD